MYEVEEVMMWVRQIFGLIEGWVYFLDLEETGGFLKVLFIAHSNIKIISKDVEKEEVQIGYDKKHSDKFILALFENLNKFSDKHNISEDVNKELSFKMINYLTNGEYAFHQNQNKHS